VSQLGNNLVLAVERPAAEPVITGGDYESDAPPRDNSGGRRMSLDVQGAEVQTVLRSLSEFSGKNIVASKEVKGQVTMRLRNVPWRHALDILLRAQALGMVEKGQTIVVSNVETLRKEEMERRTAERAQEELLPLETRILPISYANSEEMS
jgi:type IV pilus assembly protein PilQ